MPNVPADTDPAVAQLEEQLTAVYRHYEGMLKVVLPHSEDANERIRYEEYMANILDGIDSLEELERVVKLMVSLPGAPTP